MASRPLTRQSHRIAAGILCLSLAAPAGAQEMAEGPLTLRRAIATAVAGNPGLAAIRIRGRQIQAMLDESRAAFLPTAGVSYTWTRGDWPHVVFAEEVDARAFPGNASINDPGTFTVYGLVVDARSNLWAGGRDEARRGMLAAATEIAGSEIGAARNALVGQVIESFFDVLAAEERLADGRRLVETTRARRDEQMERLAQGAALAADLADVEARLAEAEAGVVHISAARARGIASLAISLGLPASTELTLKDEGDAEAAEGSVPADHDAGRARALSLRPELARARLLTKQRRLGASMAKADFLPRLDASLSVGSFRDGDPIPKLTRAQKVWSASVALSWEVFDGGARRARLARARAEVDELREVDRRTTLEVELDVKSAYLRVGEARARLAATDRRLEAAREMWKVRAAQREAGEATLSSALEGEQLLSDARMARTNAAFELRKASADVARALGSFVNAGGPDPSCCGPVPAGN